MIDRLFVLIPAAGASRRMGRPKQLLEVEGQSLLHRACRLALELEELDCVRRVDVLVVTGANGPVVEKHVTDARLPVDVVYCKDWSRGLGASIAFGLHGELAREASHLLVLLPDQPDVKLSYLQEMLESTDLKLNSVAATAYGSQPGVPAVFPASYRSELIGLTGDRGARDYLRELWRSNRCQLFQSPSGPPLDLDTPEEYERYARTHGDR